MILSRVIAAFVLCSFVCVESAFAKSEDGVMRVLEFTEMSLEDKRKYRSRGSKFGSEYSTYFGKKVLYYFAFFLNRNPNLAGFDLLWNDYIATRDLPYLQDSDFTAFGVNLPSKVILEVLEFHKDNNEPLSNLVKLYPFSQLILSQWLTIKLYEKHKINNQNLTYKDFMESHFNFTFNNKQLNIYEAIEEMRIQELNNRNKGYYSPASGFTATTEKNSLTLYDIIYDIIPNSIKREFLKDIDSMKHYIPIKEADFSYKEIEIDP